MIGSIVHATDFTDAGEVAFAHALALALRFRCRLDLLHVRSPRSEAEWDRFPHVRETLERWDRLPAGSRPADVYDRLGVDVRKVDIPDSSPADGLADFIDEHRPGLLVMATHGHAGAGRWFAGSVSSETAAQTCVPVLLTGPAARPFVDLRTGELALRRVLAPVDHDPAPGGPLHGMMRVLDGLGAELDAIHIGVEPPALEDREGRPLPVRLVAGDVVGSILAEAAGADLLAMPTAGRQGFLDALRGSTTERVVQAAPCPVLALFSD